MTLGTFWLCNVWQEKVDECYNVIQEMSSGNNNYNNNYGQSWIIKKRRYDEIANHGSGNKSIFAY